MVSPHAIDRRDEEKFPEVFAVFSFRAVAVPEGMDHRPEGALRDILAIDGTILVTIQIGRRDLNDPRVIAIPNLCRDGPITGFELLQALGN
jgi:hypothetical protein